MAQQIVSNSEKETSSKIIHLGLFAFFWSIAILWHYLRRPVDYSEFFVLFIPAVLVLARPKVGLFLFLMCVGYIHVFNYELPFSTRPNHPTLVLLINLGIIVSALWILLLNAIRTRQFRFDQVKWFDLFRPLVLLSVNIVYLMSVLNKLNLDFLDVNYSPVTRLLNGYFEAPHLLFIPDLIPRETWFLQFGIIATLVIETAIPLMLFIRPLRLWGILLGVVFHMILSIRLYPPMAEFPTLLFAVYILALPDTTIPMLRDLWRKITTNQWIKTYGSLALMAGAWFFFLLPMVFQWPQKQNQLLITQNEIWAYSWIAILVFYFVMLLYLLKQTRGGFGEPADIRWIQPRHAIVYIFPLLVFLNGLTPYMGLKNKGSWNMYSNLRVEGEYNNHLFMPTMRLFPFMNEVCIVSTSDEELDKIERNKKLFMESDFTQWARRNPDESIEFYYMGELINAERIGDYEQFMRPKTVWEDLFWIVNDGAGLEYLDWCQQYIPNGIDGPVLYLDNWTYVLWDENSRWTPGDSE